MLTTRQQKEQVVKKLSEDLGQAKSVVVSSFTSLSVNQDQGLRSDLREAGVGYSVVKKTLLKKALAGAKLDNLELAEVKGNVTVALASDEIGAAKILHKFSKDHEGLSIVGGYLESKLVDGGMIASLASLPSKEELIAKTLATINAPVQNFVGVLGGVTRLVYALNAIKESKS
jgi:large subunit ribosomal protein L10